MYKLQTYNPDKMAWPAVGQVKLDGVCGQYRDGLWLSRQGKSITKHLEGPKLPVRYTLLGELIVPGLPFKDAAGIIRRQTPQDGVECVFFDMIDHENREMPFFERYLKLKEFTRNVADLTRLNNPGEAEAWIGTMPMDAEGVVIRDPNHLYEPNKRIWGCQKWKRSDTLDVLVEGVIEADAVKGVQTGLLGRFLCRLQDDDGQPYGEPFRVGGGSSSHQERKLWFEQPELIVGKTIEIECMPGGGYTAPRQPVFKAVRDDK